MQVTHLTDNSKYLLSVLCCCSLLIKLCKQAQSRISTPRVHRGVTVVFPQYLSLSAKKICEVCWLEPLTLLWDALPRCMFSHFLPAGNPNRRGFPWSPAPHNCTTQLLLQLKTVLGSAGARRTCHCHGQTLHRRGCKLWARELLWARGCCLTLLRCGAARRCPTDAIVMPTSGQLNWHSHREKPVYLGKWDAATGLQHHWKITVRQRLNSRDLNFCRLLRARPKSYRFVLELCIWAIAWNPKTGHPLWLFMFYILYSFFIFTDSTI